MNSGNFKIASVPKRQIDTSKLNSVLDGAVADQVERVPVVSEQPKTTDNIITKKIKPEPKTQIAFCLSASVRARISMVAAQKTTATGGAEKFSNQDIMEQAVMEYLDREERKSK